ncbi:cyclase family protein [Bradyrhizobium murdochi]|uniref:cyclase family protein n=1 Tax=Bradyrhizobium murdochi TaxID=1038859 RepID=UPI000A02B54F
MADASTPDYRSDRRARERRILLPESQHAEHIGCHVDAPAHTIPDQMHTSIETVAVDRLVAEDVVYDFSDRDWKPGDVLTPSDIESYERKHGSLSAPTRSHW